MNVRICEWKDAQRMLQDGTFGDFLQMWLERYPYRGRLKQIKDYKKMFGCTFREADRGWRHCPQPKDVDFEIGDAYMLRREGCDYHLLVKVNGVWTVYKENVEPGQLPRFLKDPAKVTFECLCERAELMKAGRDGKLGKLANRMHGRFFLRSPGEITAHWNNRDRRPYSVCGDEIWRLTRRLERKPGSRWWPWEWRYAIHIDRKGGSVEIGVDTAAIEEYLRERHERLEVTRSMF